MLSHHEAQELARQGRRREAEDAFHRILESEPGNVEAMGYLAMAAMERGEAAQALELLRQARALAPDDATLSLRLGRAHESLGDEDNALRAYEDAVRLDPDLNPARLHLAAMLENQRSTEQALLHYSRAVKQAQERGRWLDPATTPPALRPLVERAVRMIRGGRRSLLFGLLEPLIEKFGRDALTRVERCLRVYLGEEAAVYPDDRQRPTFLYFPGLPTSAYLDLAAFPWIAELESRTTGIREELLRLLPTDAGRERVFLREDLEAQNLSSTVDPPSWNGYYFYRHGERRNENHAACPLTSAALDSLPLARVPKHAPETLFSVFTPGTHLALHRGVTNTRVVGHLPLIIPGDCALNVGGELHVWQEGKVVVFDDTYAHEAWNRSRQTRVILIFDLWNPYLTEVERAALCDVVVAIGGLREAVDGI
jgi:aspartate beta-hydroxylase